MLRWYADAVLVLSTDPEHVLLQSDKLARLEGGEFHCGRQFDPLLFVQLTTLHDVVGDGGATVIPGRVPGQGTGLVGNLRDVKGSRRSRFIWRRKQHKEGSKVARTLQLVQKPDGNVKTSGVLLDASTGELLFCTEDVDVDGCGGTAAQVDSLDDVRGSVSSGGVADGKLGVSWLGVDGDAVIGSQDQVSLGPFYPRIGLSFDVCRKLNLGSSSGRKTSQQLHV